MKEEVLREALTTPSGSTDCSREGEVIRAASGDATPDEVRALLVHVRRCGACAERWAEVRALVAADDAEPASVSADLRPTPVSASEGPVPPANRPWAWGAVAGLVVAAAVAVAVIAWPGDRAAPDWRAGGDGAIELSIPAGATVPDRALSWSSHPQAHRYRVRVTTPDLQVVHDQVVEQPELVLPPDLSGPHLWQVTAVLRDGAQLRSATQEIVLP